MVKFSESFRGIKILSGDVFHHKALTAISKGFFHGKISDYS